MNLAYADSIDLYNHLVAHKYHNLHSRVTRQRNNRKYLEHLNAMKLVNGVIEGYVCGVAGEVRYQIRVQNGANATVTITSTTMNSVATALAYLDRWVKGKVINQINQPPIPPGVPVRRKRREYYLQRWQNAAITRGARHAVASGFLSQQFVNTIQRWNIRVLYPL